MANACARAPRSPLRSLSTGARRAQLSGMRRLRQSGAATTIGDDGRAQRIHVNNRRCDTYGHERSSPCALHLLTLAIIACDYDLGKSLALSHAGHLRALRARSVLSCNAVFLQDATLRTSMPLSARKATWRKRCARFRVRRKRLGRSLAHFRAESPSAFLFIMRNPSMDPSFKAPFALEGSAAQRAPGPSHARVNASRMQRAVSRTSASRELAF